jgi:hypothetical protein
MFKDIDWTFIRRTFNVLMIVFLYRLLGVAVDYGYLPRESPIFGSGLIVGLVIGAVLTLFGLAYGGDRDSDDKDDGDEEKCKPAHKLPRTTQTAASELRPQPPVTSTPQTAGTDATPAR